MKTNHYQLSKYLIVNLFAFSFLVLLFVTGCTETKTNTDSSDNSTTTTTTTNNEAPKTKEEIELEAVKLAAQVTKDAIKSHQQKDSAFKEDREKEWVFQIGEPIKNQKTLFKEFKKYKNIRNVCVFENKGDYLIIKKDHQPREILNDSLGNIKALVGSSVEIIDLMAECPKRKTIVQDTPLKDKKEDIEITCFTYGK
jgi:hypothetical protein